MSKEKIEEKIVLLILGIIVVGVFALIEYIPAQIDKKICENNGGTYIWSFNKYENKCHLKGDSE